MNLVRLLRPNTSMNRSRGHAKSGLRVELDPMITPAVR